MKQQALAVGHVGIDLETPTGVTQGSLDLRGERRLQPLLHPVAAGEHQGFESDAALFVARGMIRRALAVKAEHGLVDDEVDVFGETGDEFPRFGQRSATFESKVRRDLG